MPTAVEKQTQGPVLTIEGVITPIEILSFNLQIHSPYDQQSGQTSGKRQHQPVVVTKQWDAISRRLQAQAHTGELLGKVYIKYADDWFAFKEAKFIDFHRTYGNLESYTLQFEDVETGRGAAGTPILSATQLASSLAKVYDKPFSSAFIKGPQFGSAFMKY